MTKFAFTDDQYRAHVGRVEHILLRLRADGVDSRTLYGTVQRGWTLWSSERRAMHRALVSDLWEQHAPAVRRGELAYVVGGVPGAGKTTLRSNPRNPITSAAFLVLDPEEIETEMARRGMIPSIDGLSPMEASPLIHEEAWELANRLAHRAYREKRNVLWEIPMSSTRARQHVEQLKEEGYTVVSGFADAPVDLARERALKQHRGGEEEFRNGHGFGGRYVPECVHDACRPEAPPETCVPHRAPAGASVRDLVGMYETGVLRFEHLISTLRGRWRVRGHAEVARADWVEVYRRCEAVPGDDDLFWISVAEDAGTLSAEQTELIFSALDEVMRCENS